MRDTVTGLIANYDAKGRYFDQDGVERLKSYFETGTARVQAATLINSKAASLVKQATVTLSVSYTHLTLPTICSV